MTGHKCVMCGEPTHLEKPIVLVSKCLECEKKVLQEKFEALRELADTEIARY